jgi:hypothetical protein
MHLSTKFPRLALAGLCLFLKFCPASSWAEPFSRFSGEKVSEAFILEVDSLMYQLDRSEIYFTLNTGEQEIAPTILSFPEITRNKNSSVGYSAQAAGNHTLQFREDAAPMYDFCEWWDGTNYIVKPFIEGISELRVGELHRNPNGPLIRKHLQLGRDFLRAHLEIFVNIGTLAIAETAGTCTIQATTEDNFRLEANLKRLDDGRYVLLDYLYSNAQRRLNFQKNLFSEAFTDIPGLLKAWNGVINIVPSVNKPGTRDYVTHFTVKLLSTGESLAPADFAPQGIGAKTSIIDTRLSVGTNVVTKTYLYEKFGHLPSVAELEQMQ